MHISDITLRDWKVYATANFQFPAPASDKKIILIGALNGYGKTSLFEAIVLGMFGHDGMDLVVRSPFSAGGGGVNPPLRYKRFLEKALHRGAIKEGRNSCSVKLTFVDDEGEPFEIQRVWHFNDSGSYSPRDEEVHVFEGARRTVVGPDNSQGEERSIWYRDYISKKLLPFPLAHFFMFDGEQASKLAEQEMSTQVRFGIEHLLGVPVLRDLAGDLTDYARERSKGSKEIPDKTLEKLESEIHGLDLNFEKIDKRLKESVPILSEFKEERERLTRELASFGVSSQAMLQEKFEHIKNCEHSIEKNRSQVENMLMKDVALALSGSELRKNLKSRLESEEIRERWESAKSQGVSDLERFLKAVDAGCEKIIPNLTDNQRTSILKIARGAWQNLWNPPPENCADGYLHPYLSGTERASVIERLGGLDDSDAPEIIELLDTIANQENALKRLREEVARVEGIAPQLKDKQERLIFLNNEIEKLSRENGVLEREISALEGQITDKNVELARLRKFKEQSEPSVRRAKRARKVTTMVKDIASKAVPSQIDKIAQAMTEAHRAMAHKEGIVERIDINEDCEVRLLNSEEVDVRQYDLSAGEKQIFTQSLISAVVSVSGRNFPLVIDTPLGKLDVGHRKGVLNHIVQNGHQVILLSTDTEVTGEYLQTIDVHVQKKYLVEFDDTKEIGQSTPRIGYFDKEEIKS